MKVSNTTLLAQSAILTFQFVITELHNRMRRERLAPSHLDLLLFVNAQTKAPTMTEIARHCRHSTAASTGMVSRLVVLGFLERLYPNDDRRKVCVCITPKGRELIASMEQELAGRLEVGDTGRNELQSALIALSSQ